MNDKTIPVLLLVRGLPGSGKSYFSDKLYESFDTTSTLLLDPDATDYTSDAYKLHVQQQSAEGVDAKLFPYRFLRAQAYSAIEDHKVIIWNQPFTNLDILQKVTTRLQDYALEHGTKLPILVIEVAIDPKIAKERVAMRKKSGGHGPSDEVFTRFVNEYSSAAPRGYDVIPIDGTLDPQTYTADIIAKVTSLRTEDGSITQ